jgi:hypothetical protein
VLRRLRERLTYGNVMATAALFVALGGTSYALALPKNSVGSRELRSRSVGTSELTTGAVRSVDIKNRTISVSDIARSARKALRGATGPAGPPGPQGPGGITFFVAVNSGGGTTPTSVIATQDGLNGFQVAFPRSVEGCGYSASLAAVAGGGVQQPPPGASITVASGSEGRVLVRTWDEHDQPKALPFHLIVAC